MQDSACGTERLEIPFQGHLRERAHSFKAWTNAVTSGLKDHLSQDDSQPLQPCFVDTYTAVGV